MTEEAKHVCVKEVELALLQRTVDETKSGVDSLVKLLKGNSDIGLVAAVREQGQYCKRVQEEKAEVEKRGNTLWVRFFAPVYNVAVVAVLTLLIAGTWAFFQSKNEASRVAKLDTVMQKLQEVEARTTSAVMSTKEANK
jgi:predicted ribosomally synthesized peptide with SipW-like signal peptide